MSSEPKLSVRREAWSGGDTRLAKVVARPLVRFLAQEAASGVLLLAATAVALIWANSAWSEAYGSFWETKVDFAIGGWEPFLEHGHSFSLKLWVNDGLMVLFFFVVGLEIKSEMTVGDLAKPRQAALPAIAAIGGMLTPALIFTAVTAGSDGSKGWGIPMATDIAFAVGVLALLGKRVPTRLKLFVLALAIVDDIGAIIVIALFYTGSVDMGWLGLAAAGLVLIAIMKKLRIWYVPLYVLVGILVWYATYRSGIHSTIAGVAIGLLAPARPLLGPRRFEAVEDLVSGDQANPAQIKDANWQMKESVSMTTRMIGVISPWTSFLVIPIFALANAGVVLSGDAVSAAFSSKVTLGVILGLVIGKPLGIYLFTFAAVKSGIASLPPGITMRHVLGAGAVAGIGFTVALFISGLAFDDQAFVDQSIIGILVASVIATMLGAVILRTAPAVELGTGSEPEKSPVGAGH